MEYIVNERPQYLRAAIIWIADLLLVAYMAVFLLKLFGLEYSVVGSSMGETLSNQDVVLIDVFSYQMSNPDRYDIILFENTDGTQSIKRIIGLPNETVQIVDGTVLINGEKLLSDSEKTMPAWGEQAIYTAGLADEPIILGEDEYFVLGDNPQFSEDSRFENIGNIPRTAIRGKVWFCVYPFRNFGSVE